MDSKANKIKRPKRQQKPVEDYWDCSVCTFKNNVEAVSIFIISQQKYQKLVFRRKYYFI